MYVRSGPAHSASAGYHAWVIGKLSMAANLAQGRREVNNFSHSWIVGSARDLGGGPTARLRDDDIRHVHQQRQILAQHEEPIYNRTDMTALS